MQNARDKRPGKSPNAPLYEIPYSKGQGFDGPRDFPNECMPLGPLSQGARGKQGGGTTAARLLASSFND